MSLKARFEPKESLIEALLRQKLVMGDRELAEALASEGSLMEFAAGQIVIQQGGADRDAYFLLAGKVQVIVRGVRLYPREHGVTVGEMSAVNAAVSRSAT